MEVFASFFKKKRFFSAKFFFSGRMANCIRPTVLWVGGGAVAIIGRHCGSWG
jgi:hypothetical protein